MNRTIFTLPSRTPQAYASKVSSNLPSSVYTKHHSYYSPFIGGSGWKNNFQGLLNFIGILFSHLFATVLIVLNCLSLVVCYYYLKRYKNQPSSIFSGYIAIIRTFGEFVSPAVCLIYGLLDVEMSYVTGGVFGILIGCISHILLYLYQRDYFGDSMRTFTFMFLGVDILAVYLCSCAFYQIALKCDAIQCASRIVTSVLPMMALSASVKYRVQDSFLLATMADVIAVTILCLFCAHVSVKYFFILPNLVGLILVAVEKLSTEVSRMLDENLAFHRKSLSSLSSSLSS